jgi:hypothetical protein
MKASDRGHDRSDGFGWPRRDGLPWLHLALVDVAVGSVPERRR